jgi:4-hydroxybenzoate polyprenyltransferase
MSNVKKRDDEKLITIIVCGIFSGGLLAILFTAGNLFYMGWLLTVVALITVALCAYSWHKVFKHMEDPNKNYWRFLCMAFAIIAIIVIMGHRAGWLERNQVNIDSQMEQAAP